MVAPVSNSALRRLKQEAGELKAILRHNKILLQRKQLKTEKIMNCTEVYYMLIGYTPYVCIVKWLKLLLSV